MLGVPVDGVTMSEAVDTAWSWLGGGVTRLVFTPNPEIILAARRDAELAAVLDSADLALADGVGVVWAAKRLGRPVPERIPGIEFFFALLSRAATEGRRVFFLGTRADHLERAVVEATRRFPGLVVAGRHDGYFTAEATGRISGEIVSSGADLLFVGLGAPKEQRWLAANRARLGVGLAMGVGGSFDVLAGVLPRAPVLWRRLGIEWLWRLVCEPRRWRRQLALPLFVWEVWRAARSGGDPA